MCCIHRTGTWLLWFPLALKELAAFTGLPIRQKLNPLPAASPLSLWPRPVTCYQRLAAGLPKVGTMMKEGTVARRGRIV